MPDPDPPTRRTDPRYLTLPLLGLAIVVLLGAIIGVAWITYDHLALDRGRASMTLAISMALLMGGLSASAIMMGLAAAIRYAHRVSLSVRRIEYEKEIAAAQDAGSSPTTAPLPVGGRSGPNVPAETLQLLREISENSLLTDGQKQLKLKRRRDAEWAECVRRVDQLLDEGSYHLARQACQEMTDRFGADEGIRQIAQKVEQARASAEAEDLDRARRKLTDLMSISAWDRAHQVAADVLAKHPDSEKARELPGLITRERETFEQQQRSRMYADIEKHTTRRQWKQALDAARQLIQRYGDSPEAEAVKLKVDTLEANAEIQERQALEKQIKDLIKRHRFTEAVDMARHVIHTYPESPQADVLRGQLPRLEEKAKQA